MAKTATVVLFIICVGVLVFWRLDQSYEAELIALGDSITAGTKNYGQWSLGYRRALQDELGRFTYRLRGERKSGYDWRYQRKHSGADGESNGKIIKRLAENLGYFRHLNSKRHPVILIHAGSNDLSGDKIKTDAELDTAVAVLAEMVTRIHDFSPRIDIYVALLIPSTRQPLNTNIEAYNRKVARMINNKQKMYPNVFLVDMNAAFKNDTFGLCAGHWAQRCLEDDVHPNYAGYDVLGKQWAACIKNPSAVNCNGH